MAPSDRVLVARRVLGRHAMTDATPEARCFCGEENIKGQPPKLKWEDDRKQKLVCDTCGNSFLWPPRKGFRTP